MEKVTYILGAGFSAPLGLPVMRNFLIKSKDLYFSSPKEYAHFKSVFDVIEHLSVIKNYYDADLFNIEEILSIIEMDNFLMGKKIRRDFLKYISDVISFYTPQLKPYQGELPGNWYDFIFGDDKLLSYYGYFVANLFNLEIVVRKLQDYGRLVRQFIIRPCNLISTRYAIITLNYDVVLEEFCNFINNQYNNEDKISFNRETPPGDWTTPPLAKLHGSVDIDLIVPPTWAKGTTPRVTPIWKNAYQILRESNHIRFIGYSLPIADGYIKYLIKSAVVHAKHLKSIDVICLDPDGSVKTRYEDFIKFAYCRFANDSTYEYLMMLHDINKKKTHTIDQNLPYKMNVLEHVHETFMAKYS